MVHYFLVKIIILKSLTSNNVYSEFLSLCVWAQNDEAAVVTVTSISRASYHRRASTYRTDNKVSDTGICSVFSNTALKARWVLAKDQFVLKYFRLPSVEPICSFFILLYVFTDSKAFFFCDWRIPRTDLHDVDILCQNFTDPLHAIFAFVPQYKPKVSIDVTDIRKSLVKKE